MKLIEQNLRLNPASAQDQYMRAVMLASDASGTRRREAIDSLEKFLATQSNPDPEIQYVLATLYLAEDDSRKFKTLMRALLKENKSVRYVQTFADMLVKADELDEAEVWVAELEKSAPDAEATVALESELAFRQGRFDSVRKRLQDWADRAAGDPARQEPQLPAAARMLEGFARRLRDSGDAATAATFSKEAQSVYQRYVDLKPGQDLLMAMFFARQQRLGEALDLIEAKAPTSDPVQLATACFAVLDRTGPAPNSSAASTESSKPRSRSDKQSVPLLVALAILRDFEGQYDAAETIYRDILAKEPENPTVLNNLAVLLALRAQEPRRSVQVDRPRHCEGRPHGGIARFAGHGPHRHGEARTGAGRFAAGHPERPHRRLCISIRPRPINKGASARPPSKRSRRPNRWGSRKSISRPSSAPPTRD